MFLIFKIVDVFVRGGRMPCEECLKQIVHSFIGPTMWVLKIRLTVNLLCLILHFTSLYIVITFVPFYCSLPDFSLI